MDENGFLKAQEARATTAEIKALGLKSYNDALMLALAEANAKIVRLGGRAVPVPQSPMEVV
jgi:hypothetical protein